MKVYILYFSCRTIREVLGAYSSREKAEYERAVFMKEHCTRSSGMVAILERFLDERIE